MKWNEMTLSYTWFMTLIQSNCHTKLIVFRSTTWHNELWIRKRIFQNIWPNLHNVQLFIYTNFFSSTLCSRYLWCTQPKKTRYWNTFSMTILFQPTDDIQQQQKMDYEPLLITCHNHFYFCRTLLHLRSTLHFS